MDRIELNAIIESLCEQQYHFHLLAKLLVEKGILKPGEIVSRHNPQEKLQFDQDFARHLAAIGLRKDENPREDE